MGRQGRITRWVTHPIAVVVLACLLCAALADAATNVRMTGPLSFAPLAGAALFALLLLVLVYRVGQSVVARASLADLQHVVQLGLLLPVNLVLLALVFAGIGAGVGVLWPGGHLDRVLAVLMTLALRAAAWVGSAVAIATIAGTFVVSVCEIERRVEALAVAGRVVTRIVWCLLGVYAIGMTALTAGIAGRWLGSPSREVVVAVKEVRPVFAPLGLVSVVVESWRNAGAEERIMVFRGGDEPAVLRAQPGRRLRIDTRPGLLGVPAVDHVRIDVEGTYPELVTALPSAEWPRRWLMTELTRQARWTDLAHHAREYRRHHPADRATIAGVITSLRQAGQLEAARSLERELEPASSKGRRAL